MLQKLAKSRFRLDGELRQILNNTGWLFVGKVLRMAISLVMSTWIARYLNPEGFGQLHYALAFASFLSRCQRLRWARSSPEIWFANLKTAT